MSHLFCYLTLNGAAGGKNTFVADDSSAYAGYGPAKTRLVR